MAIKEERGTGNLNGRYNIASDQEHVIEALGCSRDVSMVKGIMIFISSYLNNVLAEKFVREDRVVKNSRYDYNTRVISGDF